MKFILGGIAGFLLGLFMVLFPYKCWEISQSWRTKSGAEPTNRYIIATRIGGCILMILSLYISLSNSI